MDRITMKQNWLKPTMLVLSICIGIGLGCDSKPAGQKKEAQHNVEVSIHEEIERTMSRINDDRRDLQVYRQNSEKMFPPAHQKLLKEDLSRFQADVQQRRNSFELLRLLKEYEEDLAKEIKIYGDVGQADPGWGLGVSGETNANVRVR